MSKDVSMNGLAEVSEQGLKAPFKNVRKWQPLVEWCASGGSIMVDGEIVPHTAQQLANRIGVSVNRIYQIRRKPGFWDIVKQRRDALVSEEWTGNIYKAMYREALKGNVQAAKLLLNQADILKADKGNSEQQQVDNSITIINYAATLPDDVKRKVIEAESSGTPTAQGE